MSRILLADHSPHAQRMGERILRDEGYEVATVTDGETALLRLKDLAPDLILSDISLPSRTGYEVCEYVKTSGKYPQTRVVLTAGPVAAYDEGRAKAAGADGFVRKPFEASVLLSMVQPLIERPEKNAASQLPMDSKVNVAGVPAMPAPAAPPRPVDREQVRAAVILALEASMITMIESITDKVVVALEADARPKAMPAAAPVEARPAIKTVTAAPNPAAPDAPLTASPRETPGPQPSAAAEEPVVRIRTPIFRTLS